MPLPDSDEIRAEEQKAAYAEGPRRYKRARRDLNQSTSSSTQLPKFAERN
jgi:hypothetical protein